MNKIFLHIALVIALLTINVRNSFAENQNLHNSKDDKFILDNFPYKHMSNWTKGMKFVIYSDDNHIFDYLLNLHEYKSTSGMIRLNKIEYKNKIFLLDTIEERIVNCPRGNCTRTYVIFDCAGKKFEYEFIGDRNEMANAKLFTEISDLIYYDDIEKAREILIGKKFYLISYTDPYRNTPVVIKDVEPGNSSYPIKIKYETFDGKILSQSVSLSGTNQSETLVFNRFQDFFSSENPLISETLKIDSGKIKTNNQKQILIKNDYLVEAKQDDNLLISDTKLTSEELFVVNNFPFIEMKKWHKDMKFMFNGENSYDTNLIPIKDIEIYKNKIFTIDSIVSKNVIRIGIGEFIDRIIYFNCEGKTFEFSFYNLRNREVPYIDNLIYLGDIDIARKLLIGKQLYILSKDWQNDDLNKARKWVSVLIKAVGVGNNKEYPARIIFEYNKREYYVEISLSKTNTDKDNIWGDEHSFSKYFSFTNPKSKYPKISNDIWNLICNEKVKIGMSKQQCRLSWGEPKTINKSSGSWGVHEQWVYGSNSYLYFQNGILSSIQN